MSCEVLVRVLGGLPVTVRVDIEPADYSVGIFNEYISDFELLNHKTGKPIGDWLYEKILRVHGEYKFDEMIWKALNELREESLRDEAESRAEARYDYVDRW